MTGKRRHLDIATRRNLSGLVHWAFIEALTHVIPFQTHEIAFHGGTPLHSHWGSPRFSEDLDFLLLRKLAPSIREFMPKITSRMRRTLQSHDPGPLNLMILDRTRNGSNLLNYRATLTSTAFIGNVNVNAEFWQVDKDYLRKYEMIFLETLKCGNVAVPLSQAMPTATLEAAYADKLVAITNRNFLKLHDFFDLWWIGNRIDANPAATTDRFLHHSAAYSLQNSPTFHGSLRKFLNRPDLDSAAMTDTNRKWLPETPHRNPKLDNFRLMVDHVCKVVDSVAKVIESRQRKPELRKNYRTDNADEPDFSP